MDDQLRIRIEQAATSMLTDAEICVSLGITETTLKKYYSTVQKSRVMLKQKLNARRISDAATNGGTQVTDLVENIPRSKVKISSRGGARPGAGRKAGTTNKISAQSLLAAIESAAGDSLENLLAQGYYDSIVSSDKQTRLQYEKMFLGKVVAEKVSMDVSENHLSIEAKQAAFAEAIAQIAGIVKKH
jgi:hypothetical protein